MQLQWWIIWRYARIVAVEIAIKTVIKAIANYRETEFWCFNEIRPLRPLSRKARNFSGPKANFKIKICSIVAQFGHKPVNFASLTDSFVLTFSNYWTSDLEYKRGKQKAAFWAQKKYTGTFVKQASALAMQCPVNWAMNIHTLGTEQLVVKAVYQIIITWPNPWVIWACTTTTVFHLVIVKIHLKML